MAKLVQLLRSFWVKNRDGNREKVETILCKSLQLVVGKYPGMGTFLHRTRTGRRFIEVYNPTVPKGIEVYNPTVPKGDVRRRELSLEKVEQQLKGHEIPAEIKPLLDNDLGRAASKSRRGSRIGKPPRNQGPPTTLSKPQEPTIDIPELSPKEWTVLRAVPPGNEPLDGQSVARLARVKYDSNVKAILRKLFLLRLIAKVKGKGGYILANLGRQAIAARPSRY